MTDLHYLTATEALEQFRARELSPVELLSAVLARADRVEPAVGAFSDRLDEQALAQAREAEARYGRRGGEPRPLEGLPVALKEEQAWAGHPLRLASLATSDEPLAASHPIVERILASGAVVHARTTTPEVSCAGFTHSRLWGVTRNPWHLGRSPGGSSGGSAAALAAGTATLASGSDIAGSIRIPASMCGVVGFKPPHGRVPDLAPYSLDHYCANGPMARTVADCGLLANVLAGPDPRDAASQRPALRLPDTVADVRGLRIASCARPGDYPVEDDVARNAEEAAERLRAAGAIVEEVELDLRRADVVRAAFAHYAAIWAPAIAEVTSPDDERVMPYTADLIRRALDIGARTAASAAVQIESAVWDEIGGVLGRFDALLCPTLCVPALEAGEDYVERPLVARGLELDHYFEMLLTIPFNIAGRCPVLALPSGLAADGVPTGVQVVGRTYDDPMVFRVGAALEAAGLGFGGDGAFRPTALLDDPVAAAQVS